MDSLPAELPGKAVIIHLITQALIKQRPFSGWSYREGGRKGSQGDSSPRGDSELLCWF